MQSFDFYRYIRSYNRLYTEETRVYQDFARYYGLSECALWILYAMHLERRPLAQSELCRILLLSKQTVHSALQNLRNKGYLEFCQKSEGARGKMLRLTEAGQCFLHRTIKPILHAEEQSFLKMDPDERQMLLKLLGKHQKLFREEADKLIHATKQGDSYAD